MAILCKVNILEVFNVKNVNPFGIFKIKYYLCKRKQEVKSIKVTSDMIEKLYRLDIEVVKNRKTISQTSEYFDNKEECIKYANDITSNVEDAYNKKYGAEIVKVDYEHTKGAFCFETRYIHPQIDNNFIKNYVKIDLVEKVVSSKHSYNVDAIIDDI